MLVVLCSDARDSDVKTLSRLLSEHKGRLDVNAVDASSDHKAVSGAWSTKLQWHELCLHRCACCVASCALLDTSPSSCGLLTSIACAGPASCALTFSPACVLQALTTDACCVR